MKRIMILSLFSLLAINVWGQTAEIISVLPNQGFKAEHNKPIVPMNIVIRGSNTHFIQNKTIVQIISPNIVVTNIVVQDMRTLTAVVKISENAVENDYDILVTTGEEKVKLSNGFNVLGLGSDLTATLDVLPVQTISLADFDAGNIKNAPLFFIVSVYNATGLNGMVAKLTVSGAQYGKIGIGTKKMSASDLKSPNPFRFTNRDFDKIDVSMASNTFITNALTNNVIPPDDYKYEIRLYESDGLTPIKINGVPVILDGTNTISNPTSGLQLISPGAPLNGDPETVANKFPTFQWFSQASKFDIAVYKVGKAQTSASDIVSQLPIYSEKGISSNQLIYPNSARPLEEGVTYAWQITAHVATSRGDKASQSEVFWFTVGRPNPDYSNVVRIEIYPNDIELGAGDTLTLIATAFNGHDEKVSVKPEWRVTPADGGYVSQDGKFTAGKTPMTMAVVAKYGNVQEYATVKINPAGNNSWDFGGFVQKVFGLPKK